MKMYKQPEILVKELESEALLLDLSKSEGGGPQLIPGQNLYKEEQEDKLPKNPNVWAK